MDNKIIEGIIALGADTAAYVKAKDIKTDPIFRDMCKQNLCGNYGKNHTCPPNIGTFEEVTARLQEYDFGYIFQTIQNLEDSFDFEGMEEGGKRHGENLRKVTQYIKDNIEHTKVLFLGAGGCRVCPKCAVFTGEECRFPDQAAGSLEGYCINVTEFTSAHGLKYINGENTVSYAGLVLVKT